MERAITGERVRIMTSRSAHESALGAVFAVAGAFVTWSLIDHRLLLAWGVAMFLPGLVRRRLAQGYRRTSADIRDSSHPRWAGRFIACSAASGVAWGAVATALPIASATEVGALIALHASYVALAAALQSVYVPAFLAFAVPSTLAFLASVSLGDGTARVPHVLVLLLVAVAAPVCARCTARSLIDALRLRFAHEEHGVRLAAERDRAELAVHARKRFLAVASHDLRQPMHAIGLFAALLGSRLKGQDTGGVLDRMQGSIDALSALLDSILDMSRLDAGTMDNVPRPVPLDTLLQRIESEHEMQARAKGLSLRVDTRTDLVAQVDPTLLGRVLTNLVGNAVKYTDRGGVTVTVTADGERLSLSVRDTGRGIAANERERIFSEYHRLRDAAGERSAGLGLGLAIVERLCRLMDIPIDLDSTPGVGSDFVLSIPRGVAVEVRPCTGRRSREALSNRSVLVIDGERDILDGMRLTLAARGCRAITGRTVETALRRHAETRDQEVPDLLIVDGGAGEGGHGLEAIRRIREEFNVDIPALLTIGDTAMDGLRGTPADDVRVLRKPCSPERLLEALERLCVSPGALRGAPVACRGRRRSTSAGAPGREPSFRPLAAGDESFR